MNQRVIITISIAITIIMVGGCSKSPLCWGDDKNKGIIVSGLNINQINCVDPFLLPEKQYVIDGLDTYYNLITNTEICDSSELPEVDFEKFTLLGQYASGSCEVKFIREVTDNVNDHEYLYSIIVRDCGLCESLRYDMNWVLVPKLPVNYTVKFKIKE